MFSILLCVKFSSLFFRFWCTIHRCHSPSPKYCLECLLLNHCMCVCVCVSDRTDPRSAAAAITTVVSPPTPADDRKSRRTSLMVPLPKRPSMESLSPSPGPASPGEAHFFFNLSLCLGPHVDLDTITVPDAPETMQPMFNVDVYFLCRCFSLGIG